MMLVTNDVTDITRESSIWRHQYNRDRLTLTLAKMSFILDGET